MPRTFTDEQVLARAEQMGVNVCPGEIIEVTRSNVATATEEKYKDFMEAHEIRTGKPWDTWGRDELDLLVEIHPGEESLCRNPGFLRMMMSPAE